MSTWPSYVCRNPSCKSYGHSHPGCRCGNPGTSTDMSASRAEEQYASGGRVHYCEEMAPHQEKCEHFADGGKVAENHEIGANPDLAIDHSVISHGLFHLLTKTGHSKSEDPSRAVSDHLEHAHRGRKELAHRSKNILEKGDPVEVHKDHVESLRKHIAHLQANPSKVLDVGGGLGDQIPGHAGALGAKTAALLNHFQAIKPQMHQPNPMSEPIAPTSMQENRYTRQLRIAQNPASIYNEVKAGTVHPEDLQTLTSVYPKLLDKMRNQTTSALIDAKSEGKELPRKAKAGLGTLLGQPLSYINSPEAMQAVIHANAPQMMPQPQKGSSRRSGPTAETQKTIKQTDELYKTPLEKIQTAKS